MSGPVTEFAYLTLRAGLDLEAEDKQQVWITWVTEIAKQPGCTGLYYGQAVENKEILVLAINWDSVDHHKAFQGKPQYQTLLGTLKTHLFTTPPKVTIAHVPFPSSPNACLSAPVTELLEIFHADSQDEAAYSDKFSQYLAAAAKAPNMADVPSTGGWVIEKAKHASLGEGVEGKKFLALVGWTSIDAHLEYRKTKEYEGAAHLVVEDMKGLEVFHVSFKQFK